MPPVSCSWNDVFHDYYEDSEPYIEIKDWSAPVQIFVGRNGSGKTRTAQALLRKVRGPVDTYYLSSDRLFGLQTSGHYGGNLTGPSGEFVGVALSPDARQAAKRLGDEWGYAVEALFSLHDNPEARIRMAAAIQEALGRTIDFTSHSGLIDPTVIFESLTYPHALSPLYEAMRSMTPTPATDASRREWLRDVLASDDAATRAARLRGVFSKTIT